MDFHGLQASNEGERVVARNYQILDGSTILDEPCWSFGPVQSMREGGIEIIAPLMQQPPLPSMGINGGPSSPACGRTPRS